ncbi:hypothetical protein WT97_02620 [Burkholderia sp. MSMB1459WGS]|uniref:hypothetical protein n=1 Tax=Burkholderia sp. MSMB1459WGS TaxID=1637970 RepID=UPI00075FE0D1|nr:hypothetical protein [Burkholderia sp. MSMB1459WGS]KWO42527.1 hypothetical protein WT97_02620 [Burkholderia sp. MSMB1459WGS]
MQNVNKNKRIARLIFWAKKYAKSNPIISIGFLSGIVGGGTLFWYYLLLGQIPDFTLPQTTGLFSAAFLAGIVVIAVFSLTCVAPAALARYALDEMLPEAPAFSHYWAPGEAKAERATEVTAKMRTELLDRAFPVELTVLSILAWGSIGLTSLADFFWPSEPGLVVAIYAISAFTLLTLVLTGQQLHGKLRTCLRILVAFGLSVIATLFAFHKLGLDSSTRILSFNFHAAQALYFSGPAVPRDFVRSHVYALAFAVAAIPTGLLVYAAVLGQRRRMRLNVFSGPPLPKTRPSMQATRFWIALIYVGFSWLPLMLALEFAKLNGPAHAIRTLGTLVLYLAIFNLAFFSMASMKRNFFKACLTAIGFLVATVMIPMQQPTVIPKSVVFVLGLGNFHSSSILLSSLQCPRLAMYGIQCEPNKDDAIIVTNVNILNRMGSTATLEFQIRREGPAIDKVLESAKLSTSADVVDPVGNGSPRPIILTSLQSVDDFTRGNPQQGIIAARRCDASIASWLRSPWEQQSSQSAARTKYVRLSCVTINVPTDQLIDFDKDGTRSYKGGYSEFIARRPSSKT